MRDSAETSGQQQLQQGHRGVNFVHQDQYLEDAFADMGDLGDNPQPPRPARDVTFGHWECTQLKCF